MTDSAKNTYVCAVRWRLCWFLVPWSSCHYCIKGPPWDYTFFRRVPLAWSFISLCFLLCFRLLFELYFFLISGATLAAKIDLGTYVTWFQNRWKIYQNWHSNFHSCFYVRTYVRTYRFLINFGTVFCSILDGCWEAARPRWLQKPMDFYFFQPNCQQEAIWSIRIFASITSTWVSKRTQIGPYWAKSH